MSINAQRKEFLESLGEMTIEFSSLERDLSWFIEYLVNWRQREVGGIIACELSFPAKLALIKSLYQHRLKQYQVADAGDKVKKLERFLDKIRKICKVRNNNIHSLWIIGEENAWLTKLTAKYDNGFKEESKVVSLKEMKKLIDDIKEVQSGLSLISSLYLNYEKIQWHKGNKSKS